MMAYFFSEAKSQSNSMRNRGAASPASAYLQSKSSGDLEGCSPLMGASLDVETEDEFEFFDPFGQMNDVVK